MASSSMRLKNYQIFLISLQNMPPQSVWHYKLVGKRLSLLRNAANPRFKYPTEGRGSQLFRIRFRVPYPMFEELVRISRKKNWLREGPECTGRLTPLQMKVLAALGRGYCFDGVEELCFISAKEVSQNLRTNKIELLDTIKTIPSPRNLQRSKIFKLERNGMSLCNRASDNQLLSSVILTSSLNIGCSTGITI